jgi:hypothetical protein
MFYCSTATGYELGRPKLQTHPGSRNSTLRNTMHPLRGTSRPPPSRREGDRSSCPAPGGRPPPRLARAGGEGQASRGWASRPAGRSGRGPRPRPRPEPSILEIGQRGSGTGFASVRGGIRARPPRLRDRRADARNDVAFSPQSSILEPGAFRDKKIRPTRGR